MREIKYRVWIKVSQKIASWEMIKEKKNLHRLIENPEYLLMQYTGLKDAINKSEVYEHDIINFLGVGFLKVEWDYKDNGWICLDKRYKKRSLVDVLLSGGIKVGNIYENPELLN